MNAIPYNAIILIIIASLIVPVQTSINTINFSNAALIITI